APEPGAGIEPAYLLQRPPAHGAPPAGGPVERPVVDHHRMTIPRQLDVELDHVRAELLGAPERRQRVLRSRSARPAVGDHLSCHAGCLGAVVACGQPVSGCGAVDTPPGAVDARSAWRCATVSGA